jgi:hypothetical protein
MFKVFGLVTLTAPCGGRSGLPNDAACATPAAAAAATDTDVAATTFRRDMSFNQSSRTNVVYAQVIAASDVYQILDVIAEV